MRKRLPWILAGLLTASLYFNLFFLLNWQDRPPENENPAGTYQMVRAGLPEMYIVLQKDGQYSRYEPTVDRTEAALGRGTWEAVGDGRCILTEAASPEVTHTARFQGMDLYFAEDNEVFIFRKTEDYPVYASAPDDAVLDDFLSD